MKLSGDSVYLLAGLALLIGAVLPRLLRHKAVSTPIAFIAVGMLVGLLPLPDDVSVLPQDHGKLAERLTELCVIVALMGVGLAIDRPLRWRTWTTAWRLVLVAMPLCIGAVALLGWAAIGLAPASALLLGAALAPTDPVLASDVQVDGPDVDEGEGTPSQDEDDEVRFALTSEAGLNDGLAFPFVYAAILLVGAGVGDWALKWVGWYLVGKVVIGVLVGGACGYALARLAFRSSRKVLRLAEAGDPILAIAATLGVYGLTEVLGGYGFLAVFVCGVALRSLERDHSFHASLHEFIGQLEHMLTWALLMLTGAAITQGILSSLTWGGVAVAVLLIAVIRPACAWISLQGTVLGPRERMATAFFGVRGIGSLYYLAYATGTASFTDVDTLWSTAAFTVLLSVVVHGVTATPIMRRLDTMRAQPAVAGEPV
ncbi:MAG TPA: cation:proton antiporter [Actinomycetales bacterium]